MITIKITPVGSLHCNDMKTVECPNCKTKINSWICPISVCRCCNKPLDNIDNLTDHKYYRLIYHKKGLNHCHYQYQ